MKKFLLICLLTVGLSSYGQILVQGGVGLATSGLLHPTTEAEAGWVFPKDSTHKFAYQLSGGYLFNPYIDKTVYSLKLGVNIDKDWTVKAGIGIVNQFYHASPDFRYVKVNSYPIIVLGAERYIRKWETDYYKVYYGADFIDGHVYGKIGFRFQYKVKTK